MLATLSIRDVVLVDRLELEFEPGLCALTGETGAGKSILLDALSLSLGARAEARLVRHGASQAVVSAAFLFGNNHPSQQLLAEHGIDAGDGEVVLRRIVSADGRSRAFINDQPASVGLLRRVGEELVEIHGQFESQRLLDPTFHRGLLDAFGDHGELSRDCAAAWRAFQDARKARLTAESELLAAQRDEEELRHALGELEALAPQLGEEEELASRRTVLANAEKLVEAMDGAARELVVGGRAVDEAIRAAIRALERVSEKAEGRLDDVLSALDRAQSEAVEGLALLEKAASDMDLNPRTLESVEERLFALRALARKHGISVDELPGLQEEITRKLAGVEDGVAHIAELVKREGEAAESFREVARALTKARARAGERLDNAMSSELEPLKLGKARFITRIESLPETEWSEHGQDKVAFEVSTNPGVPPGPLSKIASGGELSRFMLALKVVLAQADPVPTLIFDEVDSGVGGAVAAAVGERLAGLAESVQILTVTHSPQVAARGNHHWRVSKAIEDGGTRTQVDVLAGTNRREEIARMLAGARVTDEARAAAESLLDGGSR